MAICGAILVVLGFHPFLATVLCLIANTSPVAYGGLGTPPIFEEDLKRSRRITLQEWEGRSWTDKLLDTAADLVSSQL